MAKDYIMAKRHASPKTQTYRGNVFRLISDDEQNEESCKSEEEKIQEIK